MSATNLGNFGTWHEAADATFGYFGHTLRVHPDVTDMAVMSLFAEIAAADEDEAKAATALLSVGGVLVHPDDVNEFWRLARSHRQGLEDIAQLARSLIEALAERPIERPSDSSAGPSPTAPTSAGDVSAAALRRLDGRPDLQVAVLRAEEARSA